MKSELNILIEGDYIDSFIYSGVLFLISSDLILRAYSWERILDQSIINLDIISQSKIQSYAKGQILSIDGKLKKTYSISNETLAQYEFCSKELLVWPSDINIYKNRFYVASEHGVDLLDFDWSCGAISKFNDSHRIFNEVSFKLATSSFYRLAIAAGNSGVLSVTPDQRYVKESHIKQIIEAPCIDCQWQNNNLIANTINGQYSASFLPIPKKVDFLGTEKEYWNEVNKLKKVSPRVVSNHAINNHKIIASWFVGLNVFSVTENMQLYTSQPGDLNNAKPVNIGSELSTLQYFKAQSSAFGTVMEVGDELKLFIDNKVQETIAQEVVNWRLFPKSTNYQNHLHIITDDYLSISLFDMPESNQLCKFGYQKSNNID